MESSGPGQEGLFPVKHFQKQMAEVPLTVQATGPISSLWSGVGAAPPQNPELGGSGAPVIADPTSSSYENQARERHSTSTRRDTPLFRATGTTTSPARTPRV